MNSFFNFNNLCLICLLGIGSLTGCSIIDFYTDEEKPQLEINVISEDGSIVENADVFLFDSREEWEASINVDFPQNDEFGTTDSLGVALFTLAPDIYFFKVTATINDTLRTNDSDVISFEEPLRDNEIRIITTTIK